MKYFCHETAVIDDGAEIGEGTRIWHWSHISSQSKIGNDCSLGQNVYVANDVVIGNKCKIQNNVSLYDAVRIEDEVISYTGISGNDLTGLTRGIDETLPTSHTTSNMVEKYEANGVSLCRINKTHTSGITDIGLNSYHIEFSRAATTSTKVRDVDNNSSTPKTPQLSFEFESFLGGNDVNATKNIQFDWLFVKSAESRVVWTATV